MTDDRTKPEIDAPAGPAPADLVVRDIVAGSGAEAKPGDGRKLRQGNGEGRNRVGHGVGRAPSGPGQRGAGEAGGVAGGAAIGEPSRLKRCTVAAARSRSTTCVAASSITARRSSGSDSSKVGRGCSRR